MKRLKIFMAGMAVVFFGIGAIPALSYADPVPVAAPTTNTTDNTVDNDGNATDNGTDNAVAGDGTGGNTTPTQAACEALGNSDCTDTSGGPSLNKLVSTVLNVLSLLIAIIAVIMIIVSGLRYVTSAGDSNATAGARNTIIYAVVGLVVAALAQVLVQFVLNRVT